jgi:hypothetical protein
MDFLWVSQARAIQQTRFQRQELKLPVHRAHAVGPALKAATAWEGEPVSGAAGGGFPVGPDNCLTVILKLH